MSSPTINQATTDANSLSTEPIKVVITDRQTSKEQPTKPYQQNTFSENKHTVNAGVTDQRQSAKKVLMIGDSILHGVNLKGIKNNVHKHSVSGATVNTLIRDIEMYDLTQFDTVIVYIGGNDLSRTRDIELIEEKYDQLIALIKTRNNQCKVILSKIAPREDVDVNLINLIVERLVNHHKIEYVDAYNAFHDRNGKLLLHYLNETDRIHLSRSGTKRLLATFNTAAQIVHDFGKCVFPVPFNNRRHSFGNSYRHPRRNHGRCINCDESSHTTEECRHRVPVTCWNCGRSGHKVGRCIH